MPANPDKKYGVSIRLTNPDDQPGVKAKSEKKSIFSHFATLPRNKRKETCYTLLCPICPHSLLSSFFA